MKVLIIGADGFLGSHVKQALAGKHQVFGASRKAEDGNYPIDLLQKDTIVKALKDLQPEVIINCAGIVGGDQDVTQNVQFTRNLLESVVDCQLPVKRIIITGSAGEYGRVRPEDIPVAESVTLNADAGYGLSKRQETQTALEFRQSHNLPVVIARVFNPIGAGMHPRFMVPALIRQVEAVKNGSASKIEVSRLDSKRDYIDVEDVAEAYKALVDNQPKHEVYNVGSGLSTSNAELIKYVVEVSGLAGSPQIVETAEQPEPLVAIQADIDRITTEFNWRPHKSIKESVEEIIDAAQ